MTKPKEKKGRGPNGQFLAGNPWRLKTGKRPDQETKIQLGPLPDQIAAYIDDCILHARNLAWAGLAVYLGVSRQTLDRYAAGAEELSAKNRDGIRRLLAYFRTILEADREEKLPDKKWSSGGLQLALKSAHEWSDGSEKANQGQALPQLTVIIPQGGLQERLADSGAVIVTEDAKPKITESEGARRIREMQGATR